MESGGEMNVNQIQNGDFETRDLTGWGLQINQGKASVVLYDRSFQVEVQPGLDDGVVLYTRFDITPGRFTLMLDATAPTAQFHQDPREIETHPILFMFVTGYAADGSTVQFDVGSWWLEVTQQTHRYIGTMPSNVVRAEVQISFPSDPLQVKGRTYIDNVSYTLNSQKSPAGKRWSQ
jgi:hypothetical protein